METITARGVRIALLGVLTGMVSLACGVEDATSPMAEVSVVTSGVTTQTNTVAFVLEPATYDFLATGTASAESADITVTVQDRSGGEVATVGLSLTLAEANANPGDTGSGATIGVVVRSGVQSISIDFRWQGATPAAEVAADLSFFNNPDIVRWTAEPSPPVARATRVHVEVEATNNEGVLSEMTVSSQFIDEGDGSVISSVPLTLQGDGLFKGDIAAPDYPGDHGLRIVAQDHIGGITQHERLYAVR